MSNKAIEGYLEIAKKAGDPVAFQKALTNFYQSVYSIGGKEIMNIVLDFYKALDGASTDGNPCNSAIKEFMRAEKECDMITGDCCECRKIAKILENHETHGGQGDTCIEWVADNAGRAQTNVAEFLADMRNAVNRAADKLCLLQKIGGSPKP